MFAADYREFLSSVFGALPSDAGLEALTIRALENDMRVRLPHVLVQHYEVAGGYSPLVNSCDVLYAPSQLRIANDYLVFCEESQSAVSWGLKLTDDLEDPPVYQSTSEETDDWYLDTDQLSMFLTRIACWQAANGGLPFRGYCRIDEKDVEHLSRSSTEIHFQDKPLTVIDDIMLYRCYNAIVCVLVCDSGFELFSGAQRESDLVELASALSIDLSIGS